jgi:hypothetical protein
LGYDPIFLLYNQEDVNNNLFGFTLKLASFRGKVLGCGWLVIRLDGMEILCGRTGKIRILKTTA